jgi:hypothetical protein
MKYVSTLTQSTDDKKIFIVFGDKCKRELTVFILHTVYCLIITINTIPPATIIIIIIISGSTVLVRTLAVSHRRFRNLKKALGRTPLDE